MLNKIVFVVLLATVATWLSQIVANFIINNYVLVPLNHIVGIK